MANSRDFTGKNRKFTGTKGITTPKGTTEQRVGAESGELRFNTTTELMEYYDGTTWKPIDAPPTISTVTTSDSTGTNTILNADGSTLYTITINGGNFSLSPVVKFIGSTGTEYTAGNVTRVSGSQITCKTTNTMGTTDDPYDVRVTNTSGLAATLDDAFSYNAAPVFTLSSRQLGTIYSDGSQTISGSTFNAGATDAEGNTITHTIISGSLPSGLSIASSTGYITGATSGTPALGNYSFIVRASTTEGVAERQFSIQVIANPFVTATGGTITTSGIYKIHTFNSSGSFVISNGGTSPENTLEYLVIAGGGGGGPGYQAGGGGAGGYRTSVVGATSGRGSPAEATFSRAAGTYTVTVGGGGAGGPALTGSSGAKGSNGSNSVFDTITSTGGGGGASYWNPDPTGLSGGCGGGAGNTSGNEVGGAGTSGQGYDGGGAPGYTSPYSGGGGGGAGSAGVGTGAPDSFTGDGGSGLSNSITGSAVTRGGGGGAGTYDGSIASGGSGGGGTGSRGTPSSVGTAGTANTGGGGGGTGDQNTAGYSGGSGVVIIRYRTS